LPLLDDVDQLRCLPDIELGSRLHIKLLMRLTVEIEPPTLADGAVPEAGILWRDDGTPEGIATDSSLDTPIDTLLGV
jgi:hypothetical protein